MIFPLCLSVPTWYVTCIFFPSLNEFAHYNLSYVCLFPICCFSAEKFRPCSTSEEPHLSCDLIWMVSTCGVQTIIPLVLRGAAPAHLEEPRPHLLHPCISPQHPPSIQTALVSPSSHIWSWGVSWRCGSTLTLGGRGGGVMGINGVLLVDKAQTKRAFSGWDRRASPHTPGWPGES